MLAFLFSSGGFGTCAMGPQAAPLHSPCGVFQKLFNQGMILAFAYEDAAGSKVPTDEVEEKNGKFFKKGTDIELKQIVAKMSKSLKNVVNPDDVVRDYGADSLRLYEMFMGPLDAVKPWQTKGIEGMNGMRPFGQASLSPPPQLNA